MPTWTYDPAAHTYQKDGAPLSASDLRALRDSFLDERKAGTADLASRLASGDLSLGAWETGMREHTKITFIAEAAFGKGGREQMTQSSYGSVGAALKAQYGYLRGFAEQVATGELSEAQITARAALYVSSATAMYEKMRAQAFGDLSLPEYPADGSQDCKSNCGCAWSIDETEDDWLATWRLGSSDHCATCLDNAEAYNPLVVPKDTGRMVNGNGRTHAHAQR